jgi:hypothetical protein
MIKLAKEALKKFKGGSGAVIGELEAAGTGGTCQALVSEGTGGRTRLIIGLTRAQASTGYPDMIH